MQEGKNMGIMITLKKPTAERGEGPLLSHRGAAMVSRPLSEHERVLSRATQEIGTQVATY
jgi:hypothetical protein